MSFMLAENKLCCRGVERRSLSSERVDSSCVPSLVAVYYLLDIGVLSYRHCAECEHTGDGWKRLQETANRPETVVLIRSWFPLPSTTNSPDFMFGF